MKQLKLVRKAVSLLLVICFIFSMAIPSFAAEEIIYGYRVKMSDFDSENTIKAEISSIELMLVEGYTNRWSIIIDGEEITQKTGDSFSITYNYIFLNFQGIGTENAWVDTESPSTFAITKTLKSEVKFSSEDGEQKATLYPYEGGTPQTVAATLKDGYYDFGTMSFTYEEKTHSFAVKINANTNTAYITRDGQTYSYSLGEGNAVYLEWWVDAQEIAANYLDSGLTRLPFEAAKTHVYSDGQIDSALSNYTITMKNNLTGLTQQANLVTALTYWARKEGSGTAVGDGSYNEYTSGVRVVKQWPELSASEKTYFGGGSDGDVDYARRPFAVYDAGDKFTGIGTAIKTITPEGDVAYQNISWPESAWAGPYYNAASARNAMDTTYGVARYRKATLTWGPYGDWKTYTRIDDACNSDYCHYETVNGHKKTITTYSYSGYSGYNYTTIAAAERAGYSWAAPDTCRATRERNTLCGVEGYSYSGYTGYIYLSVAEAERSGCDYATTSNCRTTTKTDSACGVSSYTYSGWSGYIYTAKEADGRTYADQCESTWTTDSKCGTQTSTTTADPDSFSGYYYTSKAEADRDGYSYTDFCKSSTKTSSYCGTTTTYTNWGAQKTSKYGSYTSQCESERVTSSSLCGSVNNTCTLYKCPTSRTSTVTRKRSCKLPKSVEGDTCSCTGSSCTCTIGSCTSYNSYTSSTSYSYTYGTYQKAKYGSYTTECTSSTQTSSTCGTTANTCTVYTCPQSKETTNNTCKLYSCPSRMAKENKSCYLYSCPSTRTANYKSCTFYSCPTTRTAIYNECTLYSCPGTRNVTSTTSSYVASCTASTSAMDESTTCDPTPLIRTSTAVAGTYGGWTSLGRNVNVTEDTENYIYQYMVNNGEYSTDAVKGTSSTVGTGKMFVKEVDGTGAPTTITVAAKAERAETANYGNEMTAKDIYNEAKRLGELAARAENIDALLEDDIYYEYSKGGWQSASLGWEANETDGRVSGAAQKAFDQYLNGEDRFIPWVFITAHWRATKAGVAYNGGPFDAGSENVYKEDPDPMGDRATLTAYTMNEDDYDDDPPEVIPPDDPDLPERADSKVIYFDYRDPLVNYDPNDLPDNWKGYESLIEEIQNSDFSNAKFQVKISASDLKAMRDWTHEHGEDRNCDMLREFSYIFTGTTPEFDAWLQSGTSCRVN